MQVEEKNSRSRCCWYLRRQPPRMEPPRRRGAAATHALITHTLTHESTIHPPSSSLTASPYAARFTTTIYAPFISAAFILTAAHKFDGQLLKLAPRAHKGDDFSDAQRWALLTAAGRFLQAVVTKTLWLCRFIASRLIFIDFNFNKRTIFVAHYNAPTSDEFSISACHNFYCKVSLSNLRPTKLGKYNLIGLYIISLVLLLLKIENTCG